MGTGYPPTFSATATEVVKLLLICVVLRAIRSSAGVKRVALASATARASMTSTLFSGVRVFSCPMLSSAVVRRVSIAVTSAESAVVARLASASVSRAP